MIRHCCAYHEYWDTVAFEQQKEVALQELLEKGLS